jgi:putative transposase
MVAAPEHYRWSSVHANLALRSDALVTPHASFLAMGEDAATRAAAYRQWLTEGVNEQDLASIRLHLQQERAYGDRKFQAMVEKTLNRPATCKPNGRPKASSVE